MSAANGRIAVLVMALMLTMTSVNGLAYREDIQVSVAVDGVVTKTFYTESATVSAILEEGGFVLAEGDISIPSGRTAIYSNRTVDVHTMKKVNVFAGEKQYTVDTTATTTDELEKEHPYIAGETGAIVLMETGKSGSVVDGGSYTVKEAFNVNIYADCGNFPVMIADGTVADAVALSGLTVAAEDLVMPPMSSELYEGVEIKITRVSTTEETQNIPLPYEVEYRINKGLKPGQEVVVSEGVAGEMTIHNVIKYHDGVAVSYDSEESVVTPAVNKVVECGVWNVKRDDQNAAPAVGTVNGYAYSKVISAKATAYCDKGKTASGIQSKVGVVAVDPRVIPLGTRLYIEATDGSWSYGVCLAGDTGGLIKGNRVDLFYNEYDECMQFGRRNCNIYILAD